MGCQFSTVFRDEILEITITGQATEIAVRKLEDELFAAIKSIAPRCVLYDVRGVSGRLGFGDTYFRIRNYPKERPRHFTAIVDLEEHCEFQLFFEDAAHNAGMRVKWFTDMEAARAWLKSSIQL